MKKTMLILGLVLVGQGHAEVHNHMLSHLDSNSEATHVINHHSAEQIATMIYKNDKKSLEKVHGITEQDDITMIRDLLYVWGADKNAFLKTPTQLDTDTEKTIVRTIKNLKRRYKKNHKKYIAHVEAYMKTFKGDALGKAKVLFASGIKPSELKTDYTQYSSLFDTLKGKNLYRRQLFKLINEWEKQREKFQ